MAVGLWEVDELFLGVCGFTCMPEDCFGEVSGAAIVEEESVSVDGLGKADSPEGWGAPFAACGFVVGTVVGELFAHVVEE